MLISTDTNEEFVADITSLLGPHPLMFNKEEEPRRALSMMVIHLNAGRYRLKEVQLEGPEGSTYSLDLSKSPGFFFNVKARCVNYVGTLVLSAKWRAIQATGDARSPTYAIIEDTSGHDKAWAEEEVPGLALVESAASTMKFERPIESPGIYFPVTKQTRLVITSPIKFLAPPKSFTAESGVFEAALETEDGVYFAASRGLQFGGDAHPDRKDGGIFLPKPNAKTALPGFYFGKPPAAEMETEPWRDLFMQEGFMWHLEQPTAPKSECPPNWKTIVSEWAARLKHGKWRLQQCDKPAYRYSRPSGWLVPLLLERTGKVSSDEYSEVALLVVIADGNVSSLMMTSRIFNIDKVSVVEPLNRPVWEPATK
ncbi:MAG: hypothetical protein PHE83_15360 [Opitutaceae bacterium]|nr:hypothetical protein [Opitutaceae bacterium]